MIETRKFVSLIGLKQSRDPSPDVQTNTSRHEQCFRSMVSHHCDRNVAADCGALHT